MVKVKSYFSNSFSGILLSIMIVLLCFSYPISSISSLILNVPTTFLNIIYRSVIALIALYIIFSSLIKNNFTLLKRALAMLLFLLIYLIRIIYDTLIIGIETTHKLVEIYSFYIGNICLPFLAIILAFKYLDKDKFVKISLYTLFVSNAFILVAYLNQINWIISPEIFLYRATINGNDEIVDIVNPITFGLYGGLLFIFSLGNLVLLKDKSVVKKKYILYFFMAIGLLNLILATSRGPMLFTFLGMVSLIHFYIVRSKKNFNFYFSFFSIVFSLLFLLILFFGYLEKNNIELGIITRMMDTKERVESGDTEDRNYIYNEAFSMFLDKPVFGNQMNLKSLTYPHNIFLELIMSTGIIGTCIFFWGFGFVMFNILNSKYYDIYFKIYVSLFIVFFGLSLTSGNLYQSVESWCFMALILCWHREIDEIQSNPIDVNFKYKQF
jgi:O-antigen ligase